MKKKIQKNRVEVRAKKKIQKKLKKKVQKLQKSLKNLIVNQNQKIKDINF